MRCSQCNAKLYMWLAIDESKSPTLHFCDSKCARRYVWDWEGR